MGFAAARRAGIALAAALTVSACGLQQSLGEGAGASSVAPTPAAPINGRTVTGATFSWTSVSGHPVVIDFWGSWCGPCRAEQGDINKLYSRYAGRGVVFIGVDMRDDAAAARAYERDFSVRYPSVEDSDQTVAADYDVAAPPTIVIVDQHGRVVDRLLGTVVGASDDLDRLLQV